MTRAESRRIGGDGIIPGSRAVAPVEMTPGEASVRSSEEIYHGIEVISGLPSEGNSSAEKFMRGQTEALDKFVTIHEGKIVLRSEIELYKLWREYTQFKQLQRGGHLTGSPETSGMLSGLGWGFNQRRDLSERFTGRRYRRIKL